jgi:hypothetical protein
MIIGRAVGTVVAIAKTVNLHSMLGSYDEQAALSSAKELAERLIAHRGTPYLELWIHESYTAAFACVDSAPYRDREPELVPIP